MGRDTGVAVVFDTGMEVGSVEVLVGDRVGRSLGKVLGLVVLPRTNELGAGEAAVVIVLLF